MALNAYALGYKMYVERGEVWERGNGIKRKESYPIILEKMSKTEPINWDFWHFNADFENFFR